MRNFIKNLFTPKVDLPPVDLSVLNTDMHSHLIPGIDDGAKTIEESLEMIRELQQLGYSKLITTPHIMGDQYKNTPEIILGGLEKLREALKKNGIPVELSAAAEYYFDFEFESKVENKELLTFGDNYVLFELSYLNQPEHLDGIIFKMRTAGYNPILAHVERYPYWYNSPEQYEKLIDAGVLLQLNINSLGGQYSPQTRKIAQMLIDKNMIDFLGTDCHNMHYIRILKRSLTEPHLHKVITSGKLLNIRL